MIDALRPYLQHHKNCKRGRVIEPAACPSCGESMRPVRNTSGYLNDDQFDAVKAGDFFCKRHEEIVYAWESDLPKHGCTCDLDKVLAALPVIDPPVSPACNDFKEHWQAEGFCKRCGFARSAHTALSGTPAPAEPTQEP